jgi:phosphonate degradation associated HDIG domain protein
MTATVIDRIFDLFDRFGVLYYGEDATQLQHALQTAELARRNNCSDAMIAAGLLHDVGQLMDDAGNAAESLGIDAHHEVSGSAYLGAYFPPEVTEPVRLHVAAKRYLCAIDPAYLKGLSRASALSLDLQGGPMSADEVQAFEAEPFFADAVKLRRFDDMGKHPDWRVPDLASYRPLLESLLVTSD